MSGREKVRVSERSQSPEVRASGFQHKGQMGEVPSCCTGRHVKLPDDVVNRYCLTVKQGHGQPDKPFSCPVTRCLQRLAFIVAIRAIGPLSEKNRDVWQARYQGTNRR